MLLAVVGGCWDPLWKIVTPEAIKAQIHGVMASVAKTLPPGMAPPAAIEPHFGSIASANRSVSDLFKKIHVAGARVEMILAL
jgi:hypothetical protein